MCTIAFNGVCYVFLPLFSVGVNVFILVHERDHQYDPRVSLDLEASESKRQLS